MLSRTFCLKNNMNQWDEDEDANERKKFSLD